MSCATTTQLASIAWRTFSTFGQPERRRRISPPGHAREQLCVNYRVTPRLASSNQLRSRQPIRCHPCPARGAAWPKFTIAEELNADLCKALVVPENSIPRPSVGEIEFSLHRPRSASTSTRERLPADDALDRLVQLFRKIGVEFTNLGCVGNEALIRRPHVVSLHLDRLF